MKVLVAMDEFHGIISSYQANRYVEEAVASQIETADVVQVPLFNGEHELLDSYLCGGCWTSLILIQCRYE